MSSHRKWEAEHGCTDFDRVRGVVGRALVGSIGLAPGWVGACSLRCALGRNHDDFKKSSLETTMETRMQVKYKYK